MPYGVAVAVSTIRARDLREPIRGPALALAGIVVGSFVVYALLSTFVSVPRVHPDEVRYLIGASSLVEGDGLRLRGDEYGFGPLHASVLALVLWLSSASRPRIHG